MSVRQVSSARVDLLARGGRAIRSAGAADPPRPPRNSPPGRTA